MVAALPHSDVVTAGSATPICATVSIAGDGEATTGGAACAGGVGGAAGIGWQAISASPIVTAAARVEKRAT